MPRERSKYVATRRTLGAYTPAIATPTRNREGSAKAKPPAPRSPALAIAAATAAPAISRRGSRRSGRLASAAPTLPVMKPTCTAITSHAAFALVGLAARLPATGGEDPETDELIELRSAVRAALRAAVAGDEPDADVLAQINRAAARAPSSPMVVWQPGAGPVVGVDHHGASRAEIVIAAFAADAIELLTGSRRANLRACLAPSCALLFVKDHPRREWCSNACGNRARQARHYRRTRRP